MSMTVQSVMDRASILLQDAGNVRWPAAELVGWVNDGRRELVKLKPDVYTQLVTLTLVAGEEQSLPARCVSLQDSPRNVNGPAVSVTQRGWLDQQFPDWPMGAQSGTIQHFMLDERMPTRFWVYPPAVAGTQLKMLVLSLPTDVSASSTLTDLEELVSGALVDYVCYRAFSKDAEYAGMAERALAHQQLFLNALGAVGAVTLANSPNVSNVGGSKRGPSSQSQGA